MPGLDRNREGAVSFPEGAPLPRAHLAVCHTQLLYPTALFSPMEIRTGVPMLCFVLHTRKKYIFKKRQNFGVSGSFLKDNSNRLKLPHTSLFPPGVRPSLIISVAYEYLLVLVVTGVF